jgi:hypothetical protein
MPVFNAHDTLTAHFFLPAKGFDVHPKQTRGLDYGDAFGHFTSAAGRLENYHSFIFRHYLNSFFQLNYEGTIDPVLHPIDQISRGSESDTLDVKTWAVNRSIEAIPKF